MNKLRCEFCGSTYIVSNKKKDTKFYVCPMCEKLLNKEKSHLVNRDGKHK